MTVDPSVRRLRRPVAGRLIALAMTPPFARGLKAGVEFRIIVFNKLRKVGDGER